MKKEISVVDIEKTKYCVFGLVYIITFVVTAILFVFIFNADRSRSCVNISLKNAREVQSTLQLVKIASSGDNAPGLPQAWKTYEDKVTDCLSTIKTNIQEASVSQDTEEQFHALLRIPGSHTVEPVSLNNNNSSDFISSYSREVSRFVQSLETEYAHADRSLQILFIVCAAFVSVVILSIPAANFYFHTLPLQAYAKALHAVESGRNISMRACSYGAVSVLGSVIERTLYRQQLSLSLIDNISHGDFEQHSAGEENHGLVGSLNHMRDKLRHLSAEERNHAWINQKLTEFESLLKVNGESHDHEAEVISLLTKSAEAGMGVLYGYNDEDPEDTFFYARSAYGKSGKNLQNLKIRSGQGQLGQLAIDRKTVVLDKLPANFLVIKSGLGSSSATSVILIPLLFKDGLYGALEFGLFRDITDHELEMLQRASESLAAHFFNEKTNTTAKRKLEELSNKQAEELVEIHRLQQHTYNKLEAKLQEVEEEKIKNQAILEGCVDGVISFDENGNVHFCNRAAADIFNLTTHEILKHKIFELLNLRLDQAGDSIRPIFLSESAEKEIGVRSEVAVKLRNQEQVDVLLTSTQVHIQNKILFTFFIQKISVDLF